MPLQQTLIKARACVQRGQVDAAQLAVYEQELSEPTPEAVQALTQLIRSGKRISADIAARMMVLDYPSSATAKDCLARVMAMGSSLNSSVTATAPA